MSDQVSGIDRSGDVFEVSKGSATLDHFDELRMVAATTLAALKAAGLTVSTAESCTGGLVAAALTSVPGSSKVFLGGFVTYADEAKVKLVHVPAHLIKQQGVVSGPVARAMADGAREALASDVAVAVTGVAGPTGGSATNPIGTVWIAAASQSQTQAQCHHFAGDREAVRNAATIAALQALASTTREVS